MFDKKGVVCAICNILKNMELAKEAGMYILCPFLYSKNPQSSQFFETACLVFIEMALILKQAKRSLKGSSEGEVGRLG